MICRVCETPWKLGKPLLYHPAEEGQKNSWHCNEYKCSQGCEECRDDFIAIGAEQEKEEKKREWAIVLSKGDEKLAVHYGTMRNQNGKLPTVTNKIMGDQDPLEGDINSMGGEIAVARIFKIHPDLSTEPRRGGPDNIINGKVVDVKTTTYENGRLLAILDKKKDPCEIYILVRGTLPNYELSGWCYGEELFREGNIKNLGHGPGYVLENHKLRSMEEFC